MQSPHQIFTAEFAVAATHEGTAGHYAEIEKTNQIERSTT